MAEVILPGTYITVRDEGLITAGRVASGNIGLVGTAEKGPINQVQIIGTFSEAKEIFGEKGSKNQVTASFKNINSYANTEKNTRCGFGVGFRLVRSVVQQV